MRLKRFLLLCLCLVLGPLFLYLHSNSPPSIPSHLVSEMRKDLLRHHTLASINVGKNLIGPDPDIVILHLAKREFEVRTASGVVRGGNVLRPTGDGQAHRNASRGNRDEEEGQGEEEAQVEVGRVSVTSTASNFEVRIRLRTRTSPLAAAWIRTLAMTPDMCNQHCKFYRVEGIPRKGAVDPNGYPGPPYALAQGTLLGEGFQPIPKEDTPIVTRGMVCMIEQGPNFFIALGPHPEWELGHSVFGDVEDDDMPRVDSLLKLPSHSENWGQVRVVVLNESAPFTFRLPDEYK